MTENKAAVVDAAKRWLPAKEAMLAADLTGEHPAETERALDAAEYELTDAIYRLLGKAPAIPRT